jgi:hypothetical protein
LFSLVYIDHHHHHPPNCHINENTTGDDFQASLPALGSAPPLLGPPPQVNGNGASRADEFSAGPVDLDEDGLGSGSRMYQ